MSVWLRELYPKGFRHQVTGFRTWLVGREFLPTEPPYTRWFQSLGRCAIVAELLLTYLTPET
jgi:hypothetical protein